MIRPFEITPLNARSRALSYYKREYDIILQKIAEASLIGKTEIYVPTTTPTAILNTLHNQGYGIYTIDYVNYRIYKVTFEKYD